MDREAWWAAVHGVPKSWTRLSGSTAQQSDLAHMHTLADLAHKS